MSEPMSVGSSALEPPTLPSGSSTEPKHGGFTRFELELEVRSRDAFPASPFADTAQFVQSLANPQYLNHLASRKLLTNPSFVAYLDYLQYWSRPPYLKYLTYPGPTLKSLQLLQEERFRQDIISPDLVQALMTEGMKAAVEWHKEG
jgi:mediator of RNA polymerase II transcription subunit 31